MIIVAVSAASAVAAAADGQGARTGVQLRLWFFCYLCPVVCCQVTGRMRSSGGRDASSRSELQVWKGKMQSADASKGCALVLAAFFSPDEHHDMQISSVQ
jgi:hypothetical protein